MDKRSYHPMRSFLVQTCASFLVQTCPCPAIACLAVAHHDQFTVSPQSATYVADCMQCIACIACMQCARLDR